MTSHTFPKSVTRRVVVAVVACALLPLLLKLAVADGSDALSRKLESKKLAVTNSWLESCLYDLGCSRGDVLRVCPPGSCPGHFDVRPGQIAQLRDSSALFRFDFQRSFDDKIRGVVDGGLRTISVQAPEGLCIPERYLQACEAMHHELARLQPDHAATLDAALTATRERIGGLTQRIRTRIADARLSGTRAVASGHQAAFCRWLGLNVVGEYSGGEAASPAQLQNLVTKGRAAEVRFVVANLQEGKQMGEALAYHLGATVVVFSNFPDMTASQNTFDALVSANVDTLLQAAKEKRE